MTLTSSKEGTLAYVTNERGNSEPGFAHGLTRYGGHWFDVGISVVPRDVDPLEALDKVFAKLREIVVSEHPTISYFTVELQVASDSVVPHPR